MKSCAPTILLVEDEEIDIKMIRKQFAHLTWKGELHVVNDGEEALRFLRKVDEHSNAPDIQLVLADINMPKMNGRELLTEMRQDPKLKTTVVVILTSSDDERDVQSCYSLGANAYVCKSIAPSDLRTSLQSMCDFWFSVARLP